MSDFAAILEDNADRIAAMRACLPNLLPGVEVIVFEDSRRMIDWLGEHLGSVVRISLDHDLPLMNKEGRSINCGDGRQVADYLASLPPTCPVIVHSSNNNCAPGMFFALRDAGWPVSRVIPCDDVVWVAESWAGKIRQYVSMGWIVLPRSPEGNR